MLRLGAKIISYVLHPLLMPTWLFGILIYFLPALFRPIQAGGLVLFMTFFTMTAFLPVLNLLFFKMTGTISSLHLPERRDRILPSILITMIYAFLTFMISWKMYVPIVFKLMVIITSLSILVALVTFIFRISAHAVGMSGLAGILLAMATLSSVSELILPSLVAIVLTGLTMSSRLLLNAHNLNEVGWGGVLGFGVGFGGVIFLF